jgi:hypothetical protein
LVHSPRPQTIQTIPYHYSGINKKNNVLPSLLN